MPLSWLQNKFSEVSKSLKDEVSRFRNQTFLEAVIAGCTLVAYADGIVRPEEKQKMMGALRHNDALSLFDTSEVIRLFEKYSGHFEFDRAIGEIEALRVVGKLKGKEGESRLTVRVCCAIGAADGNFEEAERQAVRKICTELGFKPSEFDL